MPPIRSAAPTATWTWPCLAACAVLGLFCLPAVALPDGDDLDDVAPAAAAEVPAAEATAEATAAPPDAAPGHQFSEEILVVARRALSVPSLEMVIDKLSVEPGGVSALAAEDVRSGRSSTIADVLGSLPGVIAQPRFGSEEARLSIRGSGLQRTYHGRGLQLLQDGVPLNLADGSFDFQAVEPLAMHYVTVLRGANAFDQGATTLGGAINFVSPTGFDVTPMVRVESGAFGYLRGQTALSRAGERTDAFLTVSHFGQDGFRDHAEQSTQRLFSNFGLRHGDGAESRLYLTAVHTDSQLPGSLTLAQVRNDASQAAAGNLALDQKRDFDLLRLSEHSVMQLAGGTLEVGGFYSTKHLDHPIFQVLDQLSHDAGVSLRFVGETELLGRNNQVTVGFTPSIGWLDDERYRNLAGERGARTASGDTTSLNATLFVEDRFHASGRTTVVAGLAASRAERQFDDRFLTDGDQSDERSFDALLPRLGVFFQVSPDWSLFGNVARSFEPPTFGELSNRGGDGLAKVDAQSATSLELGTRGHLGAFSLELSLYHARIEDELLALNDEQGDPLGTVNADRTTHSGAELGLDGRIQLGRRASLRTFTAYTYSRLRFDGDPVYGDNLLAGLPEHLLRGGAELQLTSGWYLGPTVTWAPDGHWVDHANTLRSPGYTVLDLRLGYRGAEAWQAFIEGRNVTDRTWVPTTGVIADAGGRDTAQFLPGDGAAVYAGLEWRWGGR